MMGASRASLAQAKERLAEVLTGNVDPGQVGDELFAVTGLLDTEAGLRRMLSDPARDPRAKTGLVRELLGPRVAGATLDVLTTLVSLRWSQPPDLVDATEQLAMLAIIEMAEREGKLDELEDELFRFGRVVNAEPELRTALSSPFFPAERKRDLLGALLGGKVTDATMRLVTQAATAARGRSLDVSLEQSARLAAERRERLMAEVHVAVTLTQEQRRRLAAALAAAYGRDVYLNTVLDPSVTGGISVQIEGELIDGTVAGRLAEVRRRMAA